MGRYKLDETKKREIVAIISVGGRLLTAADYVDCCVSTVTRMAARDLQFAAALKQAQSRHEIVNLQNIQDAGKKNWRASSWLLERSFPDRYARRPPQSMTAEDLAYVVTQFANIVGRNVSLADDRRKVMKRLDALAERLCRTGPPPKPKKARPRKSS